MGELGVIGTFTADLDPTVLIKIFSCQNLWQPSRLTTEMTCVT
ncbi:MAG: hypothetical protein ACRDTN_19305 [Mycobacterium sp.]